MKSLWLKRLASEAAKAAGRGPMRGAGGRAAGGRDVRRAPQVGRGFRGGSGGGGEVIDGEDDGRDSEDDSGADDNFQFF